MNKKSPLVSVLTPVYNGEEYISECIESVINQKYDNWEYIIANNCSTDSTLDIIKNYTKIDSRIRVVNYTKYVDIIENHNRAFSLVSPYSKYCKVVSSDDTIYPSCLTKMVNLAEAHPSVAIVGSYQRCGKQIKWQGIPHDKNVISGREVCRKSLLENFQVFGPPTSVLYRSDLIRRYTPFFPNSFLHADTSMYYVILKNNDLGFVHDILSVERIHQKQTSSVIHDLHTGNVAYIDILLTYGQEYLDEKTLKIRKKEVILNYNYWLGGCILKLYGLEFWRYQSKKMAELGFPIQWNKVITGSFLEIIREMKDPKEAFSKIINVFFYRKKLE